MTVKIEIQRGSAVPLSRRHPKFLGQGMLKGMEVVLDHWFKSFGPKLENFSQTAGIFTTEYPEERLKLAEAYRNLPILLYDDETGQELCTSCLQCEKICPPQVIHITQTKDPSTGKLVLAAAEFIIEYDACMGCGLCAEVCPFDSIKMDHHYELSTADHASLTMHKADLLRPVSYYQSLAPTFWEQTKENAYKKLQNTVKRRSGLLGIAPSMVGKVQPPETKPAE